MLLCTLMLLLRIFYLMLTMVSMLIFIGLMLSLAFGIFNWFSFQFVSLSLWTSSFKDLLFISVGPILCWNFENWYLLMAQPYLWCKCYDLLLLACSRWFWGSEDSIFVHFSIVHEHWGASLFFIYLELSFRIFSNALLLCGDV